MHSDAHRQETFVLLNAQRGERLREERKRLGLTQAGMAEAAGVRREMWARYESGVEPGANALEGIAAKGADVHFIVSGQRNYEPPPELTAEEQMVLEYYRAASQDTRKAAIGALVGASPGGARLVIQGKVGQAIEGDLHVKGNQYFGGKKK